MTDVNLIDVNRIMQQIKRAKGKLTRQQYRTLKGQVLAGDGEGALKGLRMILNRAN